MSPSLPGLQRVEATAWSGPCLRPRVLPAPKAGQSLGSQAASLGEDPAALCVERLSLGPTGGRRVVGQMAAGSSPAAQPCVERGRSGLCRHPSCVARQPRGKVQNQESQKAPHMWPWAC